MLVLPPAHVRPVSVRRYTVRELIHHGPHAAIYLAELCAAGMFTRSVALKVLHAGCRPEEVARLHDEARTLGILRHRAIIGALGMLEVDGRPAIVLEAASGCDLAALVARGPLPLPAALEILEEVAGALDVAWRAPREDGQPLRVTHRALSLRTVRVSAEGGVKVLGFDFARAALIDRAGTTRALTRPLAPEQALGSDGPAADIFALGGLLYHLLHGRPLPRLGARPEMQAAQLAAALDALNVLEPTRSGVVRLLSAMLSFEAEGRPSAREVVRQLSELRRAAVGPSLTTWAAGAVPAASQRLAPAVGDALVGRTLEELRAGQITCAVAPPPPELPEALRVLPWAALGAIFSALWVLGAGVTLWLTPALRSVVAHLVGGG